MKFQVSGHETEPMEACAEFSDEEEEAPQATADVEVTIKTVKENEDDQFAPLEVYVGF